MKRRNLKVTLLLGALILSWSSLTGAQYPDRDDYNRGGYKYDDRYYDRYDDDAYGRYDWQRDQDESRRIEQERERLARERERLDAQRQADEEARERFEKQQQPAARAPARQSCPAGFQQSEKKCSPDERKRGCKDMRLSDGTGCVKR